MCTVTMHCKQDSLIVTMNRDERVERIESGWKISTDVSFNHAYPIDGLANGTWFAVNKYGMILCLLNRYQDQTESGRTSRGEIILKALELEHPQKIKNWLNNGYAIENFNPFRLLIFYQHSIHIIDRNHGALTYQQVLNQSSFMATSSSEDPERIIPYRHDLFKTWLENESNPMQTMDFHLKQDPLAKNESVLMTRKNSHTKSITQCIINNNKKRIKVNYLDEHSLKILANKTQNEACSIATQFSFNLIN